MRCNQSIRDSTSKELFAKYLIVTIIRAHLIPLCKAFHIMSSNLRTKYWTNKLSIFYIDNTFHISSFVTKMDCFSLFKYRTIDFLNPVNTCRCAKYCYSRLFSIVLIIIKLLFVSNRLNVKIVLLGQIVALTLVGLFAHHTATLPLTRSQVQTL